MKEYTTVTAPTRTKPIIMLDVDGVLNFFPHHANFRIGESLPFTDGEVGRANPGSTPHGGYSRSYEINWSPTVIRFFLELHESGKAEVCWLTTWGSGANGELSDLIGFPGNFRVLGEPPRLATRFHTEDDSYEDRDDWWKFTCAKRVRRENPDTKIV